MKFTLSLVQIRPGLGVLIAGAAPPLTLHHKLPPPLTLATSGALLTLHQEQPGSPTMGTSTLYHAPLSLYQWIVLGMSKH